jgi:S1-C subfamily serine protease
MLTEIGASKKAVFEVLRGKEKTRVGVPLEFAPVDFETAERHKDDALGFTVKELTYEVRHFQKLDPTVTGVVVVRVESGSKADIGKLPPLSIVTRVNDVAVRDLVHFRAATAEARSVTLTTLSLGQTKLVELSRE